MAADVLASLFSLTILRHFQILLNCDFHGLDSKIELTCRVNLFIATGTIVLFSMQKTPRVKKMLAIGQLTNVVAVEIGALVTVRVGHSVLEKVFKANKANLDVFLFAVLNSRRFFVKRVL